MYESFNYRKNLSSIKIEINNEDYLNLINLSSGLYNPIKKFCNLKECNTILNKNKFENLKCTLPILLNCKKKIISRPIKIIDYFIKRRMLVLLI